MLYNKKLKYVLLVFLTFISGCTRSSSSSPIARGFESFGTQIYGLVGQPNVVLGFMFVAMLVGTFAMFKGLLRFAFAKGFDKEIFGKKEINVIALMLSVIGTTGIFYVFKTSPDAMINYFGGTVGLLFVLFIVTMIMNYFIHFAESFKNEDGPLKKGYAWLFLVTLGAILSSFLLLGYLGKILMNLGCSNKYPAMVLGSEGIYYGMVCQADSSVWLFLAIYNFVAALFPYVVFFGIIFGLFMLLKKKDGDSEPVSSGSGDSGMLGQIFGGSKKPKTEEDKAYDSDVKTMKEDLKVMKKGLSEIVGSVNKQKEILQKVHRELGDIDHNGGNN